MKKYTALIYIFALTSLSALAAGDFIQFGTPMSRNDLYQARMRDDINSSLNAMNQNSWSNPYAYNDFENPLNKFFKNKKNDKYALKPLKDSDVEYLLTKMEKARFGLTYEYLDINTRLDRLDAQLFGAIQDGDYKTRLNRLKHAFAAESTRDYKVKNNRQKSFKRFFASGTPTSMPVDEDYYSSLDNSLW